MAWPLENEKHDKMGARLGGYARKAMAWGSREAKLGGKARHAGDRRFSTRIVGGRPSAMAARHQYFHFGLCTSANEIIGKPHVTMKGISGRPQRLLAVTGSMMRIG